MTPLNSNSSESQRKKRGRPALSEAEKAASKARKTELQRARRAAKRSTVASPQVAPESKSVASKPKAVKPVVKTSEPVTWATGSAADRRAMVRDWIDVRGLSIPDVLDRANITQSTLAKWYLEATGKRLAGIEPPRDPLRLTDAQIREAEKHRLDEMLRQRELRRLGTSIPELHPVKNPDIKRLCKYDLPLFSQHYFPKFTGKAPLGPPQLMLMDRLQRACHKPSRFLSVLSRGFIKTSASIVGLIHAALYGHSLFSCFLGANDEMAAGAIQAIKLELTYNERLYQDFPEVCVAIRDLDGKAQRAIGQNYKGRLTLCEWTSDAVVLPTIEGFAASGCVIKSFGLEQATRGLSHKRADGQTIRPRLVILDDGQTEKSAGSEPMTKARLNIIRRSLQRLGGHGHRCSILINGTPLGPNDLIERLCNRKHFPGWSAVRAPMFPTLPSEDGLKRHWLGEYRRLLTTFDESDIDGEEKAQLAALEYYVANREEMDAGFEVSWPFIPLELNEISAIQHGMNIAILEGWDTFMSECQLSPLGPSESESLGLYAENVASRVNGYARGVIPRDTTHLGFGIDCHDEILYWTVAAVANDFSGAIVDYNTWPEQPSDFFTHATVRNTLQAHYPGESKERAIELGIEDLVHSLLNRGWRDSQGEERAITAGLVDSGYVPEAVANALRRVGSPLVYMSRGLGIGPLKKSMTQYDTSSKKVIRCGPDPLRPRWIFPVEGRDGTVTRCDFDTYWWHDTLAARWAQHSNVARWEYFSGANHDMHANHMACEQPALVAANGRSVNVWAIAGSSRDNHYGDATILAAVAASISGAQPPGLVPRVIEKPKFAKISDLMRGRK